MPATSVRLFDTRQRRVVPFETDGDVVRIYTCGITPYDSTHIGHARTFLTYDVLQRRLRDIGFETRCVRNVTDLAVHGKRKWHKRHRPWRRFGHFPCRGAN